MLLSSYSVPEFLQFETTYSCNSHCVFCYNPSREQVLKPEVTWEIVKRIGEAHVPLVQLTGGEVSLLPDINRYIDHLHPTSKVSIVTNGIKRRDLSPNLSKIFLSLHGSEVTHEKITDNPGSYETIVSNIREYVRRGFRVSADVILCLENFREMYELIRTAAELGMSEVFINRFQSGGIGTIMTDRLMPPVEMFKQSLDYIIRAKKDFGIPVVFGTTIPLCVDERVLKEDLFRNCNMGTRFASIAPNGDLRLCNQALKNYGNILSRPLVELWADPAMDDYRDYRWVTGICKECPLLERCGGGCRVDNSQAEDYCPDSFVRHLTKRPEIVEELVDWIDAQEEMPRTPFRAGYRLIAESGLLFIDGHSEKYIVRESYTSLLVENTVFRMVQSVANGESDNERLFLAARDRLPQLTKDHWVIIVEFLLAQGVLQQVKREPERMRTAVA